MQRLEKLLETGADPDLKKLVRRAQKMDRLTRCVERALSAEDSAQLEAANLREDGELVVIARSSAGAARLRYEEEAVLSAVRKAGIDAKAYRVRVAR